MLPNNTLERTVVHRGRFVLAMDCGAMAAVVGRSTRSLGIS